MKSQPTSGSNSLRDCGVSIEMKYRCDLEPGRDRSIDRQLGGDRA
ncbi:MAG: hypothetical protein SWY16_19140 [Cyanobacteriota bacterium]|nr:hypothetical protein [Cyanobacteriota bacterium]